MAGRTNKEKPKQYVSIATKQGKEWTKSMVDYVIALGLGSNDKDKIRKFMDAANGIVDNKTYDYVMKTYNTVAGKVEDLPGRIRDIDFITPIKEKYMGEFIRLYNNFTVYNMSADAVTRRDEEIRLQLDNLAQQALVNELNAQGFNSGEPSKEIPNQEDWMEDICKDYIDNIAKEGQQAFKYILALTKDNEKSKQLFYHWFTTESCYTYKDVIENEIIYRVINPLNYYRVEAEDALFIEDDNYGFELRELDINDVVDFYRDQLTKSDIEYIESLIKDSYNNVTHDRLFVPNPMQLQSRSINVYDMKNNVISDGFASSVGIVKCYVCQFKTPVKKQVLTYITPLGEVNSKLVDEDYIVDPTVGDIDIQDEWVNQVWEAIRFGNEDNGVYINAHPITLQREALNNISDCKLGFNGIDRLIKGNTQNPIPYRLLPYLALYRIYALMEERAIAKFKSLLVIPQSLIGDDTNMTMEERLDQSNKDGLLIVNDGNPQLLQATMASVREIANSSINNYLQTLNSLKISVKQEAFELASMNDMRQGEVQARVGKAVTELGVQQALNNTIWMLSIFNSFRERDYTGLLDASKIAWYDGEQGSYIDPQTNKINYVNVVGKDYVQSNLGIFIGNSAEIEKQIEQLQLIAQSAAQNGAFDLAAESVTNRDIPSLKRYIEESVKAQKEYEQGMQQAQQQSQQQLAQMQQQAQAAAIQNENEQKRLDRDSKETIALINSQAAIYINDRKLEVDTNGNGYIDAKEDAIFKGKEAVDAINQHYAARKLQLDTEKLEETKRANRAKEDIAKQNKARSNANK